MDKESKYELQKIDCNCNDCFHFARDVEKSKRLNNNEHIKTCKIHYGKCKTTNEDVSAIANMCSLDTQECFLHRKDGLILNT